VMNYVTNLQGRLMLFYGTADDNVHPANSLQLLQAFQRAGKSVEVQVGPDQGHTAMNRDRMMEFFIEHLVLRPPPKYQKIMPPPLSRAGARPTPGSSRRRPTRPIGARNLFRFRRPHAVAERLWGARDR